MVARPTAPTRSANAGEMSEDAAGRVDIKQYYSAMLRAKNVEPVPQGGFRQMGGTRHKGVWRKPLAPLAVTSPVTTAGPHSGTQTVWTGTVAGSVAAVHVEQLGVDAGTATFTVEAETAPGVWTVIGGPFAVKAGQAESRLAAFAPGLQRAATGLRIQATFSAAASVTIAAVTALLEDGAAHAPRYCAITLDDGTAVAAWVSAGIVDFWSDEQGFLGSARLSSLTSDMLEDLTFYAESRTIGLFHTALRSQRLFLATPAHKHDWRTDDWPYNPVPKEDLGGDYPKSDDVWEVFTRWTSNTEIHIVLTANGESTSAVALTSLASDVPPDEPIGIGSYNLARMDYWAARMQTALQALPGIGPGVTCVYVHPWKFRVTFGGDLAGEEYQFSALVVNTTEASALAFHTSVGKTDFEDLFSPERGWPGVAGLVQDRLSLNRLSAASAALALSRIGEYFDFNTDGQTDNAARLDKLRSRTSETILHVASSTYLVAFTDLGVYFVPNRTIERNTPLAFTQVSDVGAQPTAIPFELEGELHYVGINPAKLPGAAGGGNQVLKAVYDDVSTKYSVNPISLLAPHLITGILRSTVQAARSDRDAARAWLLRVDGRLVTGQFIASQDITGFVEWIAAHGGAVREVGIDGRNRLWLAVERGGVTSIEVYDMAVFLQDAVARTPDLAGVVTGLDHLEGSEVWAVADGYVLGPFNVASGAINLGDSYTTALVGRWQPPLAESMPQVYVNGNDEVIWRPGRIYEVNVNLIGTTSIAIGANGQPAKNVLLNRDSDPVDAPMPPRTGLVTVNDFLDAKIGTTVTFTQTKPGDFRVRDYSLGARL